MLTFFSVKNFRQFREELIFDFSKVRDYQFNTICVKNELVNKAIIYGKNAVGKTSLMEAMRDIYFTFTMRGRVLSNDPTYRNADSDENETILFHYTFLLDDTIIDYKYEKTDFAHVVAEKLVFGNKIIFEYNRINNLYNFENVDIIGAEQLQWDAFQNMNNNEDDVEIIDSLTALRFAYSNTAISQDTLLKKLVRFISGMRFSVGFSAINRNSHIRFLLNELANSEEEKVKEFQDFLNEYGVQCKLIALQDADGKKKLFFDHKMPLDFFDNMSSGTRLLTSFYLQFVKNDFPFSFVFIDEFDAYYHYELSEKIVMLLEKNFKCQVILTTHNTNLLSNSIMRPDCFLILHDGRITPICDATSRELRQGHNLEKLYMSGEFDD
ncbi:MAG: ATP-binding protein [Ruminococcus sp.]|nr:ATP-binding protein [Ruminococcus sp.]